MPKHLREIITEGFFGDVKKAYLKSRDDERNHFHATQTMPSYHDKGIAKVTRPLKKLRAHMSTPVGKGRMAMLEIPKTIATNAIAAAYSDNIGIENAMKNIYDYPFHTAAALGGAAIAQRGWRTAKAFRAIRKSRRDEAALKAKERPPENT